MDQREPEALSIEAACARLWDLHFRDPQRALVQAQEWLADPAADTAMRAWAALTIGFHHLFFTPRPENGSAWLVEAHRAFDALSMRRGVLLASIGQARLAIVRRDLAAAREQLLALRDEAKHVLPNADRFWLSNALAATYYYGDEIDQSIACLYDAFEALRLEEPSPHLPTSMTNLAAALVTVGDFAPARELAQSALALLPQFDNPQIALYARANLAEAQLGLQDAAGALATIEAMMRDLAAAPRRAAQNHYLSVAAEVYALHGRAADAASCARTAAEILADYPGGFNEVHSAWADAAAAIAEGRPDGGEALLEHAARLAEARGYLPAACKANGRLMELYAGQARWREAFDASRRLLAAEQRRLVHRASAKYYLLRVEHELIHARAERDRALAQRRETEHLNRTLESLNAELSLKVEEIEALQSRLAREVVHDPLTQLFNRRYLDSVTPGLVSAATRRGAPLAVILLDLDHFKRVNDGHGHPAGDLVLRAIGQQLGSALRPADVVCRYGGEEFCLVLPDTDAAGARKALGALAARLLDLYVEWEGEQLRGFTFSAGVAILPLHGATFPILLAAADRALYEAKDSGRNRVVVALAS
jgi:diguanylate cyclase (GGDEF)-like protein